MNYYNKAKKAHNKNSIIEEEEEERQSSTKKSKSLNQKPKNKTQNYYESSPIKDKNKYSIYYNNNKSNSPYQNNNQSHSKGHYANYGAMPNISCYNTKEKINSYMRSFNAYKTSYYQAGSQSDRDAIRKTMVEAKNNLKKFIFIGFN